MGPIGALDGERVEQEVHRFLSRPIVGLRFDSIEDLSLFHLWLGGGDADLDGDVAAGLAVACKPDGRVAAEAELVDDGVSSARKDVAQLDVVEAAGARISPAARPLQSTGRQTGRLPGAVMGPCEANVRFLR